MGFAAAGTGWWSALAADDLNGDGRSDVVAGNLGLNTPYRADAAHPVVLYAGDFKGDGSEQLIEAYYEGDRLLPRRARRDLGAALPALLKRYPRNDAYAAATLQEIIGEERLSSAQRFTATELRSGVFLSQPDGRYRFEALPRLAQLSPIQSVAIRDFDSDGILDVYVVQNSYSPVPYTGRFDGGLSQLLRGDGRGNLVPVSPQESGLIVPGPATSIAVLPATPTTILVAQNNAPLLIFRRTAAQQK
jgi:enediyne biosynthesis protein E4